MFNPTRAVSFQYAIREMLDTQDSVDFQRRVAEKSLLEAETAEKLEALHKTAALIQTSVQASQTAVSVQFACQIASLQATASQKGQTWERKKQAEEEKQELEKKVDQRIQEIVAKKLNDEIEFYEKISRTEAFYKHKQASYSLFEDRIYVMRRFINEANLLTGSRPYHFTIKLQHHNTEVMAQVDDKENGFYSLWSLEKLESRVQLMRADPKTIDSWLDAPQPIQIGVAHLPTKQLSISVGSKHIKAKICHSHEKDKECGNLMCEYDVVNKLGDAILQPRDIDSKDD